MRKVILGTTLLIALISAGDASAQGTVRGAAECRAGGRAADLWCCRRIAVGAVTGTTEDSGVDDHYFREYVVKRQPSYRIEEVRVGTVLPDSGVTYYDVPDEYHVSGYRYTIVNGRPVLVEPRSRRVMDVID